MNAAYPYTSGSSGNAGSCKSSGKTTYPLLVSPGYEKVPTNYVGFRATLLS